MDKLPYNSWKALRDEEREERMVNTKALNKVEKLEALIDTLKQMHDEDVARIVELEKFQKEVERVYPFTVDAIGKEVDVEEVDRRRKVNYDYVMNFVKLMEEMRKDIKASRDSRKKVVRTHPFDEEIFCKCEKPEAAWSVRGGMGKVWCKSCGYEIK